MMQFPFAAVTGQANLKLALLLNAINPKIGGVLVSGPKGCGKTTLARALADVLPAKETKARFINMPLGASEDRVIGSLDLSVALENNRAVFKPGLLNEADGGVLYVDEVNLLNDQLVDALLDAAATGVNRVERDGFSHEHPARFILIGTMNPDEGEIRPQLCDRFGLMVELENISSAEERVEVVTRQESFNLDQTQFLSQWQAEQKKLRSLIYKGMEALEHVSVSSDMRLAIANRCLEANLDGLRADIVMLQAAKTHAALQGRNQVLLFDIDTVAEFVLCHRSNSNPHSNQNPPTHPPDQDQSSHFKRPQSPRSHSSNNLTDNKSQSLGEWGQMPQESQSCIAVKADIKARMPNQSVNQEDALAAHFEKSEGRVSQGSGQTKIDSNKPDWFKTLLKNVGKRRIENWVFKKQKRARQTVHLFIVDTSGSVLENKSFAKAKGFIQFIAQKAYIDRERIAIVGFGNEEVSDSLPVVKAPKAISNILSGLRAGGGTPFRDGILRSKHLIEQYTRQMKGVFVKAYLLTDSRTQDSIDDVDFNRHINKSMQACFIDLESSQIKRGRGKELANHLGFQYIPIQQFELLNG